VTVRIVLVDDHPVFRSGLAALLDSVPDFEIVAEAADGPEAVALLATANADVVLMDLNLPTLSGVAATAQLMQLPSAPAVLVITMVDDDDTVVAAMRAGARGYVLKGAAGEEMIAAVRTVAAGGAVFGAGVAAQILAAGAARVRNPVAESDGLTARERDVLELLADGATNAQIARRLELSLKTVQNYVSRILDKLQVTDRTQAALRARSQR
jgi:DNA-binding NarL/FixJ family response regulator